jgi:NADH-quinone oxidoreductase subunit J
MLALFYITAVVAIVATALSLSRLNAVHALLYLIVSLLAVAVIFYLLGAPFIAALEVIVYAGAIMVLFVFVVMMLNLGPQSISTERALLTPGMWAGPAALAVILVAEVVVMLARTNALAARMNIVGPKEVGLALYGPYLIGVELASFLLMAGLVGAYHLGRRISERQETRNGADSDESRAVTSGNIVRAGADRTSGAS